MQHRVTNALASVLLAALPAWSQTALQTPADQLHDFINASHPDWPTPGLAVAVVHEDEVVFARAYGVRALGAPDPVDTDTLFAIGSATKAMTAAILGTLVDEGALTWNDPVIDHWPDFRTSDACTTPLITARDLLTHRTGLGNADGLWYGQDRSRKEILARIRHIPTTYSLRDGFVYQNIMYLAAGHLSERIAGESWETLARERLFGPLGMARTTPDTTSAQSDANAAAPHGLIDGEVVLIENEPLGSIAPAGGVWSSATEMTQWLRLLLNRGALGEERILAEATVDELLRPHSVLNRDVFPYAQRLAPHVQSYGLGWFQLDYDGRFLSFHTGTIDGMAAVVAVIPRERFGVVVLENLGGDEFRHAIMLTAIDLFTGEESHHDWSAELRAIYDEREAEAAEARAKRDAARKPDTIPSLPLERYAGAYVHPVYEEVAVALEDGSLRLIAGPRLTATLEHWHHDTFNAVFDRSWQTPEIITFHLDGNGDVATMRNSRRGEYTRRPQALAAPGAD
jgi:CubicO group peptidase (beta-lactamase class C family)